MKILVTGDRHYDRTDFIISAFRRLLNGVDFPTHTVSIAKSSITLIHGGAPGADTLAGQVARNTNWKVDVYKSNWRKYGRGAGPIRNVEMFKAEPNLILAFHNRLMESRGTKHMVSYALKHVNELPTSCPIILIWGDPNKDQWTELPAGGDLSDWSWIDVTIE